jgi:hypothetical protein
MMRSAPARRSFFSESETLAQLARAEGDEDVLGVGVHAREHGPGTLDPGRAQDLVLGRSALDEPNAEGRGPVPVVRVLVHDDIRRVRRTQVAGHLAAHAAEPADHVVVVQSVDHSLRAALVEQTAEMPGDEELGGRHQRVEERTDAQHDQGDDQHLPGQVVRRRDGAHGRDRVERPAKARPHRGSLGHHEADRARHDEHDDRHAQPRHPAQEDDHLGARAQAREVGGEASQPLGRVGHQ